MNERIYIFLDESGNLDFSPKGTRWFVLTVVSMRRPFRMSGALDSVRAIRLQEMLDGKDPGVHNAKRRNKKRRPPTGGRRPRDAISGGITLVFHMNLSFVKRFTPGDDPILCLAGTTT